MPGEVRFAGSHRSYLDSESPFARCAPEADDFRSFMLARRLQSVSGVHSLSPLHGLDAEENNMPRSEDFLPEFESELDAFEVEETGFETGPDLLTEMEPEAAFDEVEEMELAANLLEV